jgi:hypothetical protein
MDRASVLSSLTAEIATNKAVEAQKLTPVAGERGHAPLENAVIPNDVGKFMSNEILYDSAKQLRKWAADYIAIADGLDAMLAESSDPALEVDEPKKLSAHDKRMAGEEPIKLGVAYIEATKADIEDAGPTQFDVEYAAKQEAAQAAAFKPEVKALGEWRCSTHGLAIEKTSPTTGRTFIGCPDCNQFKRG